MNTDAFRHFYDYHFAENRKIWDRYITQLSYQQFTRDVSYSQGSVRKQIVHLMNVDEAWFSELRGVEPPVSYEPADIDDRERIRERWDRVEQLMRDYLAALQDEMLFAKPFSQGEDKDLILWQVLIHVANHGTDHRAQLLAQLNRLGIDTEWQDYVFYVYGHPLS